MSEERDSNNAAEALANLIEDFGSANIVPGEKPLPAIAKFANSINWTPQRFIHRFLNLVSEIRSDVRRALHIPPRTAELADEAVNDASQLIDMMFTAANFQAIKGHIKSRNIIRELRFVGAFIDKSGVNDSFDPSRAESFVKSVDDLLSDVLSTLPNSPLKQSIVAQLRTLKEIFEELRYHGMAEAEAAARMLLGTLLLRIAEFEKLDDASKDIVQKVAAFLRAEYKRIEPFLNIGSAALQVYGFLPGVD